MRLAGKALGVMLRVLRFLGLVTTNEVMATGATNVRDETEQGRWRGTYGGSGL